MKIDDFICNSICYASLIKVVVSVQYLPNMVFRKLMVKMLKKYIVWYGQFSIESQ